MSNNATDYWSLPQLSPCTSLTRLTDLPMMVLHNFLLYAAHMCVCARTLGSVEVLTKLARMHKDESSALREWHYKLRVAQEAFRHESKVDGRRHFLQFARMSPTRGHANGSESMAGRQRGSDHECAKKRPHDRAITERRDGCLLALLPITGLGNPALGRRLPGKPNTEKRSREAVERPGTVVCPFRPRSA